MTDKNETRITDQNGNPISREEWIALFDLMAREQSPHADSKFDEEAQQKAEADEEAQQKAEAKAKRKQIIALTNAEAIQKLNDLIEQAKADVPNVKEQVKKTSENVKDAGWVAVAVTTTVFKNIMHK